MVKKTKSVKEAIDNGKDVAALTTVLDIFQKDMELSDFVINLKAAIIVLGKVQLHQLGVETIVEPIPLKQYKDKTKKKVKQNNEK